METFHNAEISFTVPHGGIIKTFEHDNRVIVVRVIGKINEKIINIDIQPMPGIEEAHSEVKRLSEVDRFKFPNEEWGPEEIKIGPLTGWRYITQFTEGFRNRGYLDTTMINTEKGVYRISMKVYPSEYDKAREVIDKIIHSFRISE